MKYTSKQADRDIRMDAIREKNRIENNNWWRDVKRKREENKKK